MEFLMDLFPKILDMSITASVVILVVIAARLLLKKAPKVISYALWGVVLLRLLVPFSIPSDFSLIPERVGSGEIVSELSDIYVGETWIIEDDSPYYDAAVFNGRQPVTDESGTYVVAKYDQLGEPETVGNTVMPMLSVVWLAGVAAMLVYSVVSYVRLRRQLRVAIPVRDNIFIADDIKSPFVVGFIRPRIYLPGSLGEKEQAYIIMHERHHISRCDHIIKLLSFAALSIHWFNPLVWLAFALSAKDMEMSCDEAVIGKMGEEVRADYSASLLTLATGRRIIAGTPLAFGEGSTESRIKNLSGWRKPVLWVVVAAVVGCAVLAVCLLTDRIEEAKLPPIGPRTYTVAEVTYEAMLTSFQNVPGVNTPVYTVTDGKQLLSRFKDEDWKTLGVLNEFELTKENFDDLLKGQRWTMSGSASSFRKNNVGAWKLVSDHDILYYILQQKDGEVYLCYGLYDYSETDDPYSDDTMINYIFRLSSDISEDMGIVAVSGERSVPVVVFPSNTAVTDVAEEVFWLDIVPRENESTPFTMYCDGREILGFFSIYDAETLESLAYFHPSGLSPQTYIFQNAEQGKDYIITMRTSMEEITDMYCFGARLRESQEDEPDDAVSVLSLNDVIVLSQKGYDLTWEDFSDFKYVETGSGLYIHSYYINDLFSLSVGGTSTEGQPMYIYLNANDGTGERIDIRDGGVTEFIENHRDNAPVESHISAVFSSEMYTWVNYSEEGYNAMVERAENRDTERRYGNIEHLTPVVKLETKREFDDFYREMSKYFQFEQSWVDSGPFSADAERFDKAFFSENTLFIAYLEEPSTSIRHELEEVRIENGVLEIRICRIQPQAGDSAMAGWFLSVGVPKNTAAGCTGYDAYICAEVNPDNVFPSSPLVAAYGYDDGDILNSAMVSLYEDGQFQFIFSPLSSYIAIGNYTIENGRLTLRTHDGMFVYVFDMVDDTLVFDAEASTDRVWYSGITDGSVFESGIISTQDMFCTATNLVTEEIVVLSGDECMVLAKALEGEWQSDGVPACDNDFEITLNDDRYYYHSDCGTFFDRENHTYKNVDTDVMETINNILHIYDHTQPTPEGYFENTANHDEITAFCKDAFQEFFRAVKQGNEADFSPYINSDALKLYMEHRVQNHVFAYSAGTRCKFQIVETAACGEYTLVKGQFITYNSSTNSESGEGLATLVVKSDNGKFVITEWYWPFKGSPDEKYRNNFSVEDNLDYWENELKYSNLIDRINGEDTIN